MSLEHFVSHADDWVEKTGLKGIIVTFIAPASGTLTDFNISIVTAGATFTAELFASGSDGMPTGSAICSKTGCTSAFGLNNANTFTSSGSVTAGSRYCLKISVTSAGTISAGVGNHQSLHPYEFSVRTSYDSTNWILWGYGGFANVKIGGSWYGTSVHKWESGSAGGKVYAVSSTSISRRGVVIRPVVSGKIKMVSFNIAVTGTPNGVVRAEIYSGTTLLGYSSSVVASTGLATVSWIRVAFSFDGVDVTAGSEYYVVLSPVGYWGDSTTNYMYVQDIYSGIALGYGGQATDADKKLDGQIGYVYSTVDSATPSWTANNSAAFASIRVLGEIAQSGTILIED